MEVLGPLIEVLKSRPDIFITVVLLSYGLLERQERQRQQKSNFELQDKMLNQNIETREALTEMNTLLRILTQGRH